MIIAVLLQTSKNHLTLVRAGIIKGREQRKQTLYFTVGTFSIELQQAFSSTLKLTFTLMEFIIFYCLPQRAQN